MGSRASRSASASEPSSGDTPIGTFAGTKVVRYHRTHPGNRLDRWLLKAQVTIQPLHGASFSIAINPSAGNDSYSNLVNNTEAYVQGGTTAARGPAGPAVPSGSGRAGGIGRSCSAGRPSP